MTRREALLLAALVLGAFALCLPGIGKDAAWIDEAASIGIGALPWSVLFGEMARIEASPPGYYALAKVVGILAGPTALPLRLLSAAAAALSLVPVWLFCRAAFGSRAAWLAAALVGLNASLIRLSQDGRTYAVLFLLFCCALLAAWRLVEAARRGEGGSGALVALGLAQGAMLWLHHTAAIANVGLNAFVLAALVAGRARLARGLLLLAGADAIGVLTAAPPILWALGHAGEGAFVTRWIAPPGLFEAALIYVHGVVAPFHDPVSLLTVLVTAGLLAWGTLAWSRPGWPGRVGLTALLGVAGLAFPAISQAFPVMMDRTVLFLVAPLAAAVAAGIAALPPRGMLPAAALMLGLHAHGALGFHTWPTHREDWHAVADLLAARMEPGDLVVVTDSVFVLLSLRMAIEGRGREPPPLLVVPATSPLETRAAALIAPDDHVAPAELCARIAGARTVWLITRPVPPIVQDDPGFSTRRPSIAALRAAAGERIAEFDIHGLEVDAWRVPGC